MKVKIQRNVCTLVLALLMTQLAAPVSSHADICQPGAEYSIRLLPVNDQAGHIAIVTCPAVGPCWTYSLFNRVFTPAELSRLRTEEEKAAEPDGPNLGDLFTMFAIAAAGSDSAVRMSPAAQEGTVTLPSSTSASKAARKAEAKENAGILSEKFLNPSTQCVNVPSIDIYKDALVRALQKIPASKVVEIAEPKLVKTNAQGSAGKPRPAGVKGAR